MISAFKLGQRRLLKLARMLDTADAEHRRLGEPTYSQTDFTHSCLTPACAMGHWARANPRRWMFSEYGAVYRRYSPNSTWAEIESEFCLSAQEAENLFGSTGCDNARTAKQAARYIRRFVAQRERARLLRKSQT